MSFLRKFAEKAKSQEFIPNALSIFINPSYFSRRALYRGIKAKSGLLKGVLLDFGCGSKPYRDLFTVDQYIGIDIEVSGHPHQKKKVDVFYDGNTIPFPANHFDSVFSSEVFEHVFNLDDILTEINRVMKPGAEALFTTPFVIHEHEVPYDFGRYTSFGMKHIMEKHGFEVITIDKTTHYVEVLFQLTIWYIFGRFPMVSKYLTIPLTLIFITPLNFLGRLFAAILPKDQRHYNNLVTHVRKVR